MRLNYEQNLVVIYNDQYKPLAIKEIRINLEKGQSIFYIKEHSCQNKEWFFDTGLQNVRDPNERVVFNITRSQAGKICDNLGKYAEFKKALWLLSNNY